MKKAIAITLSIVAGAIAVIAIVGAIFFYPVGSAVASAITGAAAGGPPWAGGWHNGGWGGGQGFNLPPALQGLASIPANQRFDHFTGVQVNLKDQNNNPMTINVVPGKISASSGSSLTVSLNKGGSQTYGIDSQTIIHAAGASRPAASGTPAPTPTQAPSASLQNGDEVIVVTLNDSSTATAVIAAGPNGFGRGPGGWWGH